MNGVKTLVGGLLGCLLFVAAAFAQDTDKHPALQITQAKELFEAGDQERATYLYYVAQMRFRIHLMARPDLPQGGDPALFLTLSEIAGKPINEWAFGDPDQLVAIFDRVLEWHSSTDDTFTPKAEYPVAHETNLNGLKTLRDEVANSKEQIRAGRTKAGLENR